MMDSSQIQLHIPLAFNASLCNPVKRCQPTAEQRGLKVVGLEIPLTDFGTMVGITINTAVPAGIVKSYINACGASAVRALIFVFIRVHRASQQPGDQFSVDAMGMFDAVAG